MRILQTILITNKELLNLMGVRPTATMMAVGVGASAIGMLMAVRCVGVIMTMVCAATMGMLMGDSCVVTCLADMELTKVILLMVRGFITLSIPLIDKCLDRYCE